MGYTNHSEALKSSVGYFLKIVELEIIKTIPQKDDLKKSSDYLLN
jgi:hypothetical protein